MLSVTLLLLLAALILAIAELYKSGWKGFLAWAVVIIAAVLCFQFGVLTVK